VAGEFSSEVNKTIHLVRDVSDLADVLMRSRPTTNRHHMATDFPLVAVLSGV